MKRNQRREKSGWLVAFLVAFTLTTLTASQIPAQVAGPSLDALLSQAIESEKNEDYAGAEKIYRQALLASPDQPEVLKRLGIVCQNQLKFEESIEVFQKILKRAPLYPQVKQGKPHHSFWDDNTSVARSSLAAVHIATILVV